MRLFPERRDQAVHAAAMLRALADGVDVRRRDTREIVADDDATLDRQARAGCELDIRLNAGCDDDHVALERGAVRKCEARHVVGTEDGPRRRLEVKGQSHFLEKPLQDLATGGVELAFHQVCRQVYDMDVEPRVQEATSGFEAQQPSPDHGGASDPVDVPENTVAVGERAKHEDARSEVGRMLCPR